MDYRDGSVWWTSIGAWGEGLFGRIVDGVDRAGHGPADRGAGGAVPDPCRPDSFIPRRFKAEISTMIPTQNHTGCSPTTGIAEPMLATTAAVDTATVRM